MLLLSPASSHLIRIWMLLMFLSGFGKIYSDFSDQLKWGPSARINDLFHQRVRSCDGHQDSEMSDPIHLCFPVQLLERKIRTLRIPIPFTRS